MDIRGLHNITLIYNDGGGTPSAPTYTAVHLQGASFENLLGFSFSEIAKIRTMDLRELKGKMQIRYGRLKNRLKIRTIDDDIAEAENQAAVAAFETGGLAAYLRELNAGKGDK